MLEIKDSFIKIFPPRDIGNFYNLQGEFGDDIL